MRLRSFGPALLTLCLMSQTGCIIMRGNPPVYGIPNFDVVDGKVLRGAQPTAYSLHRLASEYPGATVINLRPPGDSWSEEAAVCSREGLRYVNLPWSGTIAPSQAMVEAALGVIASAPKFGSSVERTWFCQRVRDYEKVLGEKFARELGRNALLTELRIYQLDALMNDAEKCKVGDSAWHTNLKVRQQLAQQYQGQLEQLREMLPGVGALAGKYAFAGALADVTKAIQAYKILAELTRRAGCNVPMPELMRVSGSYNVHSRIAELRKRGFNIPPATVQHDPVSRQKHSSYRLVPCPSRQEVAA